MTTYLAGLTHAGNIAVIRIGFDLVERIVLVTRTNEIVRHANFPSEICKTPIDADSPEDAAVLAAPLLLEDQGERIAEQHRLNRIAAGLEKQLTALRQRTLIAVETFRQASLRRGETAPIGELWRELGPVVFNAAKCGHSPPRRVYLDEEIFRCVRHRLADARAAKRKLGHGWKPKAELPSDYAWFSLSDAKRKSPLRFFHYRLALIRAERTAKKAAALAKRRAPLRAFALHLARQFHRHKPNFGQTGDGVRWGSNSGNSGSMKRGGPGTRCSAGVYVNKGKVTFYPTHGAKEITLPMPPMKLWKRARVGIAHPLGLFCVPGESHPGVDENFDYDYKARKWILAGLSIRAVRVTEKIARGEFTVAEAIAEPNSEVRRIMLEKLPPDAITTALDADGFTVLKEVHRDDFGQLWKERAVVADYRQPRDEHLALVKVVNSTPEPDGSYRDYWLRVPGTIKTAKAAVAWTFGKTEAEYAPFAES